MIGILYQGDTGISKGLNSYYGSEGVLMEVNGNKVLRIDIGLCDDSYGKIKRQVEEVKEFYSLGTELTYDNKHLKMLVGSSKNTIIDVKKLMGNLPKGTDSTGVLRKTRSVYRLGVVSTILELITTETLQSNAIEKTSLFK